MYVKRHGEKTIQNLAEMFGAILVTGPRQVGKTTMLKKIIESITYITLDDPILLMTAKEQSTTFFKDNPPPIFIDEIQHAPNLFPQIKMYIDKNKKKGQFFLSGSQQFKMMKDVSESLAGRIGLFTLLGLSLREKKGVLCDKPFLPTDEYLFERKTDLTNITYNEAWEEIHRGSMPELWVNRNFDWQIFYGSYVKTYIERDVRDLAQVGDEMKFLQFMTVVASYTGQLLNVSSLARNVGISQPTADRWLSILIASNIIYLLKPYFNNITKRTIKTPKLYFLDTGLAAYLTRWNTPETLKNGAMAGAFFESFIISEIIKSYYNKGILEPPLYFYRDKDMNEIDLLIENDGTLYPIEIKKHADPTKKDISQFRLIDKIPSINRGAGGVICLYDNLLTLKDKDKIIPVKYI